MKLWALLLIAGCAPISEQAQYARQDRINVCVAQQQACTEAGGVIWGAGCRRVAYGERWSCVSPDQARQAIREAVGQY